MQKVAEGSGPASAANCHSRRIAPPREASLLSNHNRSSVKLGEAKATEGLVITLALIFQD